MAEILIKAGAVINDYQPGDVIAVKPEGWNWGNSELDPTLFRIVSMPGMPSEYEYLLADGTEDIANVIPESFDIQQVIENFNHFHDNAKVLYPRRYQVDYFGAIIDKHRV